MFGFAVIMFTDNSSWWRDLHNMYWVVQFGFGIKQVLLIFIGRVRKCIVAEDHSDAHEHQYCLWAHNTHLELHA